MPLHKSRILYEDEHLLIVNKLPHELVVAAEGDGKLPLFDFLRKDYPGLRVLHRLDFGTSGVVAFARTKEAAEAVKASKFAGWIKRYRCIVAGRLMQKEGVIDRPLAARATDKAIPALTRFRVILQFRDAAYVEAQIDTGRKHQIRQHFAQIGHPLFGDPLYGDKKRDRAFNRATGYRKFFLHAFALTLPHPITGKSVYAEAPLPQAFEEAIQRLKGER